MSTPDLEIDPALFDDAPPAAPAAPDAIEPDEDMQFLMPSIGAAAVTPAPALPAPLAIAEVLGADFPLPALVRWVPDLARKQRLDQAVTFARSVDVASEAGLGAADAAMAAIRAEVKLVEADFAEPKRLAHELHASITGRLAEWLRDAKAVIDTLGRAMAAEQRRRDEAAAKVRREAQAEADRIARQAAAKVAEAAQAQGAPAPVVEQLQQQAATTTAPPVPVAASAPAPLAHSTVTRTWRARIAGTPADAPPRPAMADLTAAQQHEVRKLLAEVVAGRQPLTLLEIAWGVIDGRARAEKSTLALPGIEAYEELGTRAKAGRRV